MRLVKSSLHKNGRFFEAIKDDLKGEIYFHEGKTHKKGYLSTRTKQWNTVKKESRVYEQTSLSFFTPCKNDHPLNCAKGIQYIERKYNENAELLDMSEHFNPTVRKT